MIRKALSLLNSERRRRDLPPLPLDERLCEVALKQAEEMVRLGYFSHYSPVTGSAANRVRLAGIAFSKVGENVGRHTRLEKIHEGLMHSPSHRGNILHPEYEKVGIAVVRQADGRLLMVQVFAKGKGAGEDCSTPGPATRNS